MLVARRKMILLRVGLTGGIASGKSSLAKLLSERGIPVIDSDTIARVLVAPGSEVLPEIARALGAEVVAPDGGLDRKRVGQIVFADDAKRKALEKILHPRIMAEQDRWLNRIEEAGESPVAVVEAALMIESGGSKRFDLVVVVNCGEAQQIERFMERAGVDEAAARARIEAQMPLSEKVKLADRVVDNSGSLPDLAAEAESLVRWLRERAKK
ncbi:MAG: dephospho-CoA kinase [Nitrospinae bacterium]|nr:dephospho-CoA kinase [Nitrospinota bacterium]